MPLFEFPRLDEDEAWWVQKEDEKFKLYEENIRKMEEKYEKYLSETYTEYRENILSRRLRSRRNTQPHIMSQKTYQQKKDSAINREKKRIERMKEKMIERVKEKENIFI